MWNEVLNLYDQLKWIHSAEGISQILGMGGLVVLAIIIYAETGLLIGFFLPGDSLLITAGVLSNPSNPNHLAGFEILSLNCVLIVAAVVGDQTGYFLGKKVGNRIWQKPDSWLFKRQHLKAAQEFYNKYGAISIVAARYVPIIRTFVPFVAGVARMPYRHFAVWNILGGILWITSLVWLGFYLGQTTFANRLDKIIVLVIFVSVLPMILGVVKKARLFRTKTF